MKSGGSNNIFKDSIENTAQRILKALESKEAILEGVNEAKELFEQIIGIYLQLDFSKECCNLHQECKKALEDKTLNKEKLDRLEKEEWSIRSLLVVEHSEKARDTFYLGLHVFMKLDGFEEVDQYFFTKLQKTLFLFEDGKASKDEKGLLKNFFKALLSKSERKISPNKQFLQRFLETVRTFFV